MEAKYRIYSADEVMRWSTCVNGAEIMNACEWKTELSKILWLSWHGFAEARSNTVKKNTYFTEGNHDNLLLFKFYLNLKTEFFIFKYLLFYAFMFLSHISILTPQGLKLIKES